MILLSGDKKARIGVYISGNWLTLWTKKGRQKIPKKENRGKLK